MIFRRFLKLTKKKKIIVFAILTALLALAIVLSYRFNQAPEPNLHLVGFGDIRQELGFTGKVKPSEEVELSFERSGRVEGLFQDVGDAVAAGHVLASLDSASALVELEKAKATLKSEEAKLEELKQGSRPEEIGVYLAKLETARVNVEEAKKSLADKINDAYTKSDDAVYNQADQLFTDPNSQTPRLSISPVDTQLKSNLESSRIVIGLGLNSWEASLTSLSVSSDLDSFSLKAKQNLEILRNFFDKVSSAVNSMTVSSSFSQTIIDGYKSDISTARTNINLAISNLSSAQEKLGLAQANFFLAERELILTRAGASLEEIHAQEARVLQAKAGVSGAELELSKMTIRAPINGVISQKEISVGEIATANKTVFKIISSAGVEIDSNVTEIDIAKIKVGDAAKVTLDAYGPEVGFTVKMASVEPAETVIEGVSTYKTKFIFETDDERVKPGMTANIELEINLGKSVLVIPQAAVELNGDRRVVAVFNFGKLETRAVRLGQRGADGLVEVLDGLQAGEKIVMPR